MWLVGGILGFSFIAIAAAVPIQEKRFSLGPSVTLSYATVVGSSNLVVDSFSGIPFAQPPLGQLRLKPPQPIVSNLGTIQATSQPRACPQFMTSTNTTSMPSNTVTKLQNSPFLQTATNTGEDCLTINVQRPSSAKSGSKLPVLFWIYGGGFEFGSTQSYDATEFITNSITQGKPFVYVAVNYRLGGFGFLPGKEILADGSANLGLLDQRLGLQWVADNIAAFGGDPSAVTIWGESAGSISVFDQMALYNGNYTYKGKPLFRAGIMDSGSVVPADPVDCPKGQTIYNTVVQSAGCAGAADTLACLRGLSYETYLNAANSVPGIFGFNSLALSYLPRPDGSALTVSPEILVATKQYAQIPFIIGDQEDEGTLFSLSQSNLTTSNDLVNYFQTLFFNDATTAQVQGLVNVYPQDPAQGSPFRTGVANQVYPQFKRLAAMLGDLSFTLVRRSLLNSSSINSPSIPTWSYLASYDYGTPILGTYHSSDVAQAYGQTPDFASASIQSYYLSFINTMDPNNGTSSLLTTWPQWSSGQQLLNFNAATNTLLADNFRSAQYQYIVANTPSFHV